MPDWLRDYYREIRPNALWDIIKLIGVALIALFSWYTSTHAVLSGVPPILIAVAVFVALAFAVAAIAWAIDRFRKPQSEHQSEPLAPDEFEVISGRTFINEVVQIDGKSYRNCIFRNVTFEFNGGQGQIRDCVFQGAPQHIKTENHIVMGTVAMLKGLGFIEPNFGLQVGPYRDPLHVHAPLKAKDDSNAQTNNP